MSDERPVRIERARPAAVAMAAILVLAAGVSIAAAGGQPARRATGPGQAAAAHARPAAPSVEVVALPSALLPDLRMARIRHITVQRTASGHRLLRFTTWIVNVGDGPFEVRGARASRSVATMRIVQRVHTSTGTVRTYVTPAVMKYAGDGHNHWHTQRIAIYELWSVASPTQVRRGAKVGFCFFDTNLYKPSLAHSPAHRVYSESGCGVRASLSAHMGISVGWADDYPWNFAWQWVDVTGLKSGVYMLRVTVDRQNWFRETNDDNNCNWSEIHIGAGSTVHVLAAGTSGCPTPPPSSPSPSPSPSASPSTSPSPSPSPSPSA